MKDWTNDFRDKLIGHRLPLPENDLDVMMGMIRRHELARRIKTVSGVLIASAAVVAAVLWVYPTSIQDSDIGREVVEDVSLLVEKQDQINDESIVTTDDDSRVIIIHPAPSYDYQDRMAETMEIEELIEEETPVDSISVKARQETNKERFGGIVNNEVFQMPAEGNKKRRLSLGFSSGGIGLGSSVMESPLYHDGLIIDPDNSIETVHEHHQPRKVGLSISYKLSEKANVVSGLDYAYCYSKVSHYLYDEMVVDQHAHYLGVPLHLDFALIRTELLSFYIGAGGEAWRCIHASLGGNSVNDKRVYLSAVCLAGIEYKPTKAIGLFMEPQHSHTFLPDKTIREGRWNEKLNTAITDCPDLFTVNVGLRFRFD